MNWLSITLLGACGGAVVQAVTLSADVHAWQQARRAALTNKRRRLPELTLYVDPPADALVFLTRIALGALAGFLFHTQVTGATAAVAVGASAPALLRQFGAIRSAAGLGNDGIEPEVALADPAKSGFPAPEDSKSYE